MPKYILRLPEVQRRYGLSRSTIYLHINQGLLPASINIGPRAVGIPEDELEAIFSARIAGATNADVQDMVTRLMHARADVPDELGENVDALAKSAHFRNRCDDSSSKKDRLYGGADWLKQGEKNG